MHRHLMASWNLNIWISENLKYDYLKNEKSFWSEIKKTFFLVSQVLSFTHKKQTIKNVAGTTFKTEWIIADFRYFNTHLC